MTHADQHALPAYASCPFRSNARTSGAREDAVCGRIERITGLPPDYCRVADDACAACCDSPWESADDLNPVINSLACDSLSRVVQEGGIAACNVQRAGRLKRQATAALELLPRDPANSMVPARSVETCVYLGAAREVRAAEVRHDCHHPERRSTSHKECLNCRYWSRQPSVDPLPLHQMIPLPRSRSGSRVSQWAVGVTTALRRQTTLDLCLDSLARAGWTKPHLFADGGCEIPARYSGCPVTRRDPAVGPWPNYLLALSELCLRFPHADAYLLAQDDSYFYDATDLRRYLEAVLWPGGKPGIVSLYATDANSEVTPGWHVDPYRWLCGALAFVFPPELAQRFLADDRVHQYRRCDPRGGTRDIDLLIGEWAQVEELPVWYPQPSLVQHIGDTTTIWTGTPNGGLRRARWFAGDLETPFHAGSHLASFHEAEFQPKAHHRDAYGARVARGRERMLRQRAVICGLCRDVRQWLPRTLARIEALGRMFRDYEVVLFENDSQDDTLGYLQHWALDRPNVHILSEQIGFAKFPQIRSRERAARLAQCRNRYLDFAYDSLADFDCLIPLDTDLRGGWSYDGIADSFGADDWDCVGSYGIIQRVRAARPPQVQWRHFDTWAFRRVGHHGAHDSRAVAMLGYTRGDPMLRVGSCFGGLAVYRAECLGSVRYAGSDCEHVCLHNRMRAAGYDRQYLNPSQIVVY